MFGTLLDGRASSLCCDEESMRVGCDSSWLDEESADPGDVVSMVALDKFKYFQKLSSSFYNLVQFYLGWKLSQVVFHTLS